MKKKLVFKEIVILAMISVLMGVVFMGIDSIYEPLKALLGPFAGASIYGVYLVSALLSMYIMRKPGAGLVGSLFTGVVNLLMGSPYGIHIIVAAFLQGLGVEIITGIGKHKTFNMFNMSLAAILSMLLVTTRDYFVFGFSSYGKLMPLVLLIRSISSVILGAGLSIVIGEGLFKTGLVKKDRQGV